MHTRKQVILGVVTMVPVRKPEIVPYSKKMQPTPCQEFLKFSPKPQERAAE